MLGHADHGALLAEEGRGEDRLPAQARGGHPARHRGRQRDDRAPRARNGSLRPGVPPVRVGRPERRGADRPRRRLPRSAAAEGRGPNDRVPEHGPRRLDASDDRARTDQAPPLLPGRRPQSRPGQRPATRSTSMPTRSSTSTERGSRRSFRKKPVGAIRGTAAASGRATTGSRWRRRIWRGTSAGSTRAFTVRLRYIDLFKHKFTPRGRILRVRVSTDAKTVGWRLGRTRGNAKPPLIRLPVPSKPGRYTLTVTANGHRARATVVVRK